MQDPALSTLPIDPAAAFRDVLERLSGRPEVSNHEIRQAYAEELGARLVERFANFTPPDFDEFYAAAIQATRPVRLEIEDRHGRSIWLSAAIDIPRMAEAALADSCSEQDVTSIAQELARTAASGESFERDACDRLLTASPLDPEAGKRPVKKAVSRAFASAALAAFLFLSASEAIGASLMRTVSFRSQPTESQNAIMDVLRNSEDDPVFSTSGVLGKNLSWKEFERATTRQPPLRQLEMVNSLWNSIPYREDSRTWKQEDYWATPTEFSRHGGDCEDYAIAKYATLRKLGFEAADLRVLVVTDVKSGGAHAVLAVWLEGKVHILDNRSGRVQPAENLAGRYLPVMSVNEQGIWKHMKTETYAANKRLKPASGAAPASGGR